MTKFDSKFSMKDLDPHGYFFGIFVTRHTRCLFSSEKKCVKEIIECAGTYSCKLSFTPLGEEAKLNGSSGNSYHDPTVYLV